MLPVLARVMFYALVVPAAWVLRRLGRDPLERRREPSAPSYWTPRRGGRPDRRFFHSRG